MVNQELLNKEIEEYRKVQKVDIKEIKASKDFFKIFIPNLFKEYKWYTMTENSYCCYGEEHCCWQELIEEGNWDLTLKDVRMAIIESIKDSKKHLYHGGRLFMYKDADKCYLYIYCRDKIKTDFHIWFYKEDPYLN
jgi:hypothetical protein